jgi:hypothetical protein
MEPNDLVVTPEGQLAYVREVKDGTVITQIANHETLAIYPAEAVRPIARGADIAAAATEAADLMEQLRRAVIDRQRADQARAGQEG